MQCPNCKKIIPSASIYCPECGQSTELVTHNESEEILSFWKEVKFQQSISEEVNPKKNSSIIAIIGIVVVFAIILIIVFLHQNNNESYVKETAVTTNEISDSKIQQESNVSETNNISAEERLLEECEIVDTGAYKGNEGDSFVYIIGKHQFTRGSVDVLGANHEHGLEAWIARRDRIDESSWAYATYDIGSNYSGLSGRAVLIDSYNTDNFDTTLFFYNAETEQLLGSYKMNPDNLPFDFAINIEGVNILKVLVSDNQAVSGGTSFGLIDVILNKEKYQANDIYTEQVKDSTINTESPFSQNYWIIFTEASRNGRVEASSVESSLAIEKLYFIWDSSIELCDTAESNDCNQYYLNDSNEWEQIGSYFRLTDCANEVLASNLDVYDPSGNLICKGCAYDKIDWDIIEKYK